MSQWWSCDNHDDHRRAKCSRADPPNQAVHYQCPHVLSLPCQQSMPKGLDEYPNLVVEIERPNHDKALIAKYEKCEEDQTQSQFIRETAFLHHLVYPPPKTPLKIPSITWEEGGNV